MVNHIKFTFKGDIDAEVMIGGEWDFRLKGKTLTFINMVNAPLESIQTLLQYKGRLEVVGGYVSVIANNENTNINLNIVNLYDYTIDNDYGAVGGHKELITNMGMTPSEKKAIEITTGKDNIVRNNINAPKGKLFLVDGSPYTGDCHKHSNGQYMTGGVHNSDSKNLYLMTDKGLFIPDQKITKDDVASLYNKMTAVLRRNVTSSNGGGY